MTTELNIQCLRLRVPAAEYSRGRGKSHALAKDVAASLGKSLKKGRFVGAMATFDEVHVKLPRGRFSAEKAAGAILSAIGKRLATARRQR